MVLLFGPTPPGWSCQPPKWPARLRTGLDDGGFVWLHVNLAHSGSENNLRAHLGLPEDFYAGLREGQPRPRIEQLDGEALRAVINDVIFTFGSTAVEVSSLWVYADAHLLITARL